jgi:hypothetical protein
VLRGTPIGELAHLKSYRLEGGALIYTCTDQQSGQWLIRAIDNHRLGSGARLKARNLPKPLKVALRTRDRLAQTQDELLSWIKNLNPGLHMENWRVLGRQSQPKGQRLILHIDRDCIVAIQKTGYKIFTGLSQGTVKVLRDPEVQKEKTEPNTASSESVSEEEGDGTPTPLDDRGGASDAREEISPSTKSTSAYQVTSLKGTWSDKKEIAKEGMKTDP